MNKVIKQYLSGLLLGLGSLLLGFILAGLYSSRSFEKPNIKDITSAVPRAYIVQSGSMEPTIKTGSVVFTLPTARYSPGDIVTYSPTVDDKSATLITHRINFKLYPDGINADPVYITSGDANQTLDSARLGNENIVGKVFFSVPFLGYIANFAKQPYGFILLVIVPATIVIYEELRTLLREILKNIKRKRGRTSYKTGKSGSYAAIKAFAAFPLLGAFMVFIALTGSYFTDTATSTGNVFSASDSFGPEIAQTLVINEVLPISSCSTAGTTGQFIELWNGSGSTVNLQNYKLTDGTNVIAISNSSKQIANNNFVILVKSTAVINNCLGNINNAESVNLGGTFDINTGHLQLLDSQDNVVDTVKWGSNFGLIPTTNNSIERKVTGQDSAIGVNFEPNDFKINTGSTPGI